MQSPATARNRARQISGGRQAVRPSPAVAPVRRPASPVLPGLPRVPANDNFKRAVDTARRILPWLRLLRGVGVAQDLWNWFGQSTNIEGFANWTYHSSCSNPVPGNYNQPTTAFYSGGASFGICGTGLIPNSPGPGNTGMTRGPGRDPPLAPRVWPQHWYTPVGVPSVPIPTGPIVETMPLPIEVAPIPAPVRWVDPDVVPPLHPEAEPWAPPVGVPRPRPNPEPSPGTEPAVSPAPYPGLATDHVVNSEPRIRAGYAYNRRPPPPGEKEQKLITQVPPGALSRALNAATEGADLIDCLHAGLPPGGASRRATPQEKLVDLWDRFGEMDWGKALSACIQNEVEDRLFGAIGRAQAKANRRLGLTGGTIGRTQGNIRRTTR